jgi:hypothetical protein
MMPSLELHNSSPRHQTTPARADVSSSPPTDGRNQHFIHDSVHREPEQAGAPGCCGERLRLIYNEPFPHLSPRPTPLVAGRKLRSVVWLQTIHAPAMACGPTNNTNNCSASINNADNSIQTATRSSYPLHAPPASTRRPRQRPSPSRHHRGRRAAAAHPPAMLRAPATPTRTPPAADQIRRYARGVDIYKADGGTDHAAESMAMVLSLNSVFAIPSHMCSGGGCTLFGRLLPAATSCSTLHSSAV